MKKTLFFVFGLLLLLCVNGRAAVTNVEAVVTFTNTVRGVTNGDSIAINGDIRRYTNGTLASAASWIRSTNSVGWAATNTWLHLGQYNAAGVDYVSPTNTNAIIIASTFRTNTAHTVTLSAGVGTVFYRTNVWADVLPISGPNGALPTAAARTNNASRLIELLNDNRQTNAVANGVAALSNLLDRISYQTSSNKTFFAATNNRGLVDYTRITNASGIHGTNGVFWGFSAQQITNLAGTNATFTNVALYNVGIYGITNMSGTPGFFTNGAWQNIRATNGYTLAITNVNGVASNLIVFGGLRSEGAGANSLQVGSNAVAASLQSLAVGVNALATNSNAIAIGTGAQTTNTESVAIGSLAKTIGAYALALGNSSQATNEGIAIGYGARSFGLYSISMGNDTVVDGGSSIGLSRDAIVSGFGSTAIGVGSATLRNYGLALGYNSYAGHSNSAAIGPPDHAGVAVSTTTTNQIRIGTPSQTLSIPGLVLISGTQSNTTFAGTNIARGAWAFPAYNLGTLAAGNNIAVPVGTNRYIRANSGPASSATICGMIGGATSGGLDGQDLVIYNDTGFDLVFATTTSDPVPANRIATPSGTNTTIANQGWAQFIYDGTDQRWRLINAYNGEGALVVQTNATTVGSALSAINFSSGITGHVSGGVVNLGVSVSGGVSGGSGIGAYVWTGANTFTDSAFTAFAKVACASGKYSGVKIFATFKGVNGSNIATHSEEVNFSTYNDGSGPYAAVLSTQIHQDGGSFNMTLDWDIVDNMDGTYNIRAQVTPVGVGSGTTIVGRWHLWLNTDDTPSVTPL